MKNQAGILSPSGDPSKKKNCSGFEQRRMINDL
jgi:hypothetical protein